MKKGMTIIPLVGDILLKVAPQIGATIVLEPEWNVVGQITFKSGRRRYFRTSTLDINTMAAAAIAKDKDYANFFMDRMGYPIVPGRSFFSNAWAKVMDPERNIDSAYRYARVLDMPVIVKPNSGTRGQGVALVYTKRDFYRAMRLIFKEDKIALVQQPVKGNHYRLVVLDDRVISAYQRLPLSVAGDGDSTVLQLLTEKQREFDGCSRDTKIKIDDPRITEKLKRSGRTFVTIPDKGERIFLLDNANLSSGGDSVDITEHVHPEFRELAVRLTRDMGLRLCGVDLMVDGDITQKPERYWVLEINSAPGLDHYAKTGQEQAQIVENLYLEVLKSMEY